MRRSLIFGCFSLLALPAVARAQQARSPGEVVAANAAFDMAVSRRDLPALEALCLQDESVTAVHPRDRAPVVGWVAVRRSWEETFGRFAELSVTMPEPRVRLTGEAAIVVGLEKVMAKRASDGAAVVFDAMTTNMFQRQGGRWLMVHHHATMVPA